MLTRRQMLGLGATLGMGTALASIGPSSAHSVGLSGGRARIPSYGPNGTHWPANTPARDFGTVLHVGCSWAAIRQALIGVTPSQASGGVIIRVAPGTLPAGAVLRDLGSTAWPKNVLVIADKGWGTVTISETATIRDVAGVTFARLNGHHVRLIDCCRTNWVQSKLTLGLRTYAESQSVTECNVYEVVMPNSGESEIDAFSYAATAPGSLTDCRWEGCYGAPFFRPAGSNAHLDTYQMFGTGFYRGLTIQDSVFFGANNCGLQVGSTHSADPGLGTDFVVLDHSAVLSASMSRQTRYTDLPLTPGHLTTQAINGTGEAWQMSAINSTIVLGSMHLTRWKRVSSSYTSHAAALVNNPAQIGSWIYDPRLHQLQPQQLDSLVPMPSDHYLRSIWR